jgi:hypothetical protein
MESMSALRKKSVVSIKISTKNKLVFWPPGIKPEASVLRPKDSMQAYSKIPSENPAGYASI